MKQSAKAITLTGLAGASALAGASQSYGAIISVKAPTNITGVATTSASLKEYYDFDTGTTSTTKTAASDVEFGYYNSSTEFFTGVYGFNGSKAAAYEYGGSGSTYTAYAYGIAKGGKIGTGGSYAFAQHTGYFTLMSFTYNGNPYNSKQTTGVVEYLGVQFTAADGLLHDGWIALESDTYTSAANPGGLKFLGAAYNSVADASGGTINAGQAGAVPEPGTLSALAIGAAGLVGVGLKRRKAAAAQA